MKKLLFILFFATACNAQVYQIYDCTTYQLLGGQFNQPTSGCYTLVQQVNYWCCPYWNPVTSTWYNNATTAQQNAWLAAQVAMNSGDDYDFNDALVGYQTDTELNALYSSKRKGFIVWTTSIDTGIGYMKMSPDNNATWKTITLGNTKP